MMMKRFIKQIALLVVVIAAFAILRNHAPAILPTPAQQYIHGSEIKIPVAVGAPQAANSASWSLVQMKNQKYEVFVRYKGQIKGKFDAAKEISSNGSGKDFAAVGKAEFGTQKYNASTIHINPDGRSGFILFTKSSGKPAAS
jgi:hypothetical protein